MPITPLRRPEIAALALLLAACSGKKEKPRAEPPPPTATAASEATPAAPAADTAPARAGKPAPCGDYASCRDACVERKRGACLRMQRRATPDKAAEIEKTAAPLCDAGHAEACHVRFLQLKSDRGAVPILTRGCQLAYGPSCAALAAKTKDKAKRDEFNQRAATLLDRQCQTEDAVACAALAEAARTPPAGETPDLAKARWYGDRACDLGDEGACYALARQLGDKYPDLVIALLDRACELDEPRACADLGDRRAAAQGDRRDMKRAAAAWQAACDSGVDEVYRACEHLAQALIDGSLPRDPARSQALRQRSAELARRFEAK